MPLSPNGLCEAETIAAGKTGGRDHPGIDDVDTLGGEAGGKRRLDHRP